jgi:ribosome-associated toxin RatA of RatAB toxin-antitoxin module
MHTIDRTRRQTKQVDIAANASTTARPEVLFAVMNDLTMYPKWLDLVQLVAPVPSVDTDPGPAFDVTLRATVGPFARSKRLRMSQTESTNQSTVSFVRSEVDGRDHANWQLNSVVTETTTGSQVEVTLRYDGSLWSPIIERVLRKQIEAATPRLQALAENR